MTLRQQAFMHYNGQPFNDWIEKIYNFAPDVKKAQSSENDPNNKRHSDVSWIDVNEDTESLFQYIFDVSCDANENGKWGFETGVVEPLQFTEYKVDQKYDWHVDHLVGEVEDTIRKISFTILLNDDFEGGELQLEAGSPSNDQRVHTMDMKKGDICFFPSYTWHRVTPVTKGVRHSLVGWIRGPQWK